MENKTPELYAFIDKMDSELGDVWTSDRDCLANVLDTYASLQCAEMRREVDELNSSARAYKQVATAAKESCEHISRLLDTEKTENISLQKQCAEMKEERDYWLDQAKTSGNEVKSLKESLAASERIRMSDAQSAIREANSLRGRIEQLQEEVERLRSIINEVQVYPETKEFHERLFLSAKGRELFKALSGKESKTDK